MPCMPWLPAGPGVKLMPVMRESTSSFVYLKFREAPMGMLISLIAVLVYTSAVLAFNPIVATDATKSATTSNETPISPLGRITNVLNSGAAT
jgi:hypothetical protein